MGQIEINNYICVFYICNIIIPFLTNEELINLVLGKKIDVESKTFLFYFAKIVKKIFRCNFYDSFEQHLTIFNTYLCEILPFINSIVINLLASNINISKNSKNKEVNKENKYSIEEKNNSTKIIKYDSMIINEKIFLLIFDFLLQCNNDDPAKIEKIFSSDQQLKESFDLILKNYYEIIQQLTQNNEIINQNNNKKDISDNNNVNNAFGGPFYILVKEDISKLDTNKITLSTYNQKLTHTDLLPKVKFSLIKLFELLPNHFMTKYIQFNKNKSIIDIFTEIKSVYAKIYISDFLSENNLIENENQIPFIWYLDYCLNNMIYLSDEYKKNDYKELLDEIKIDIKNEISFYQNDLSEFAFSHIIDNINEKIESMDNLFEFYNQNTYLITISNFLFNCVKIKIDIYEYGYEDKIFLYNNKLNAKDYKELSFIRNITIENVSDFIKYISNHILNEDILNNFSEIDNNSKKNYNQIDNINKIVDDTITSIKNITIEEYKKQIDNSSISNNNNNNNNEDITIKEKEIEKMEYIMNLIEELIQENIYRKVWKYDMTTEDIQLVQKCEENAKIINPTIIGVNEKYINESIFENIINLMETKYNINNYRTPNSKIKCVENIYKIINSSICVITNKTSRYSIDDIFPIFVYLLIKSKIQFLFTNLNYIKLLIGKKNLIKSSGFALTQLEMAIQYLQNIELSEKKI